jgi:uncharacterized protein YndB with AHSA1/START domain
MLSYLAIALLAFVAGVLIVAARKPDIFEVSRSATIRATPERIFALLADFQEWGAWSPYEKKDPAMKRSFKGGTSGVGAVYAFDGNKQAGTGELAIVEVQAPVKLAVTLDMTKPMACHNLITFTLAPAEGGTLVTWRMEGACPFLGRSWARSSTWTAWSATISRRASPLSSRRPNGRSWLLPRPDHSAVDCPPQRSKAKEEEP